MVAFPDIRLMTEGLRGQSFKASEHRGQIELCSDIGQVTEKRLIRAFFNLGEIPLLGTVVDYEVPLKGTQDAAFGDIDLVCSQPGVCLCIEAKQPASSESVLKPVLQAFTYTLLVSTQKTHFCESLGFDRQTRLVPAVLTYANSLSGRQLRSLGSYPKLTKLIRRLNAKLALEGIGPMRFFIVSNADKELATCLIMKVDGGDQKAVFHPDFRPRLEEVVVS